MTSKFSIFIAILLVVLTAPAQENDEWQQSPPEQHFQIKIYPLRALYGPNAEFTWVQRSKNEISFLYQYHYRDFFSVGSHVDGLGFSYIPRLMRSAGYTVYLSYMMPVSENVRIGPKLGYKNVFTAPGDSSKVPDRWPHVLEQENLYLLFNMLWRNRTRGLIIEAYLQGGLVGIKREKYEMHKGVLVLDEKVSPFILPHVLGGVSIGFGW